MRLSEKLTIDLERADSQLSRKALPPSDGQVALQGSVWYGLGFHSRFFLQHSTKPWLHVKSSHLVDSLESDAQDASDKAVDAWTCNAWEHNPR